MNQRLNRHYSKRSLSPRVSNRCKANTQSCSLSWFISASMVLISSSMTLSWSNVLFFFNWRSSLANIDGNWKPITMFISGNQWKSDSSETDFASRLQVMMASKHSSVPRPSSLKLEICFKSSRKTDNKFDFLCCSAIDLPNKNVELPFFFWHEVAENA